ncbi:MAG TPA: ClpXP protease specificity-enhancing factor SspB [Hyphomicrobiaceae bacterium]|jgi:hypothetical protein|nr:ClpXP protease specificity-enhancing factor SspB [Hyphomicrobiaceae bacterium]
MTGEREIDYEALAQDAMRGIVRAVLERIGELGRLPGEHHFYIAFDTRAPGVQVSKRLKQKYPEEMTIVLQHQFWNLSVDDERFEVTLSFDNVPERLTVPLRAVRVFFDPSVPYVLQFEGLAGDAGATESAQRQGPALQPGGDTAVEPMDPGALVKARAARKPRAARIEAAGALPDSMGEPGGAAPRRQPGGPKLVRSKPDQPANDAKVVELDKFRKK